MFSIIALKFVEVFRIIMTKMLHLVRVVLLQKHNDNGKILNYILTIVGIQKN